MITNLLEIFLNFKFFNNKYAHTLMAQFWL